MTSKQYLNVYLLLDKFVYFAEFGKLANRLECVDVKDDSVFIELVTMCLGSLTETISDPMHLLPDLYQSKVIRLA